MKYWYITFNFCTTNGVQGMGFRVYHGYRPRVSDLILKLNITFNNVIIVNILEITSSDYQAFSEETQIKLE